MGREAQDDPIEVFKTIIIQMGILDRTDAEIYAHGLREGIITSSRISQVIPHLRQSTAGDRLRHLANNGFFQVTPRDGKEKRSGRTHAIRYRAISPEIVLKEQFKTYEQLQVALQKMKEHLEIKAEVQAKEEDIWLVKSQKLTIAQGAEMIRGAKKSITIFARDCTWLKDESIKESISSAYKRGIDLEVLASDLGLEYDNMLVEMGASLVKSSFSGPPFCVIDKSALLIPYRSGPFEEYGLIVTTNNYLVEKFSKLFRGLFSLPNVKEVK